MKRISQPKRQRRVLYEKQRAICYYCGFKILFINMTLEHIIPRAKNGSTKLNNTVMACKQCNHFDWNYFNSKNPRNLIDWNISLNKELMKNYYKLADQVDQICLTLLIQLKLDRRIK